MWGTIYVSQACGAEAAASSQEARALVGALWLTHCLTASGHIASRSICCHICNMAVGLGHLQGPFQLGDAVVWGLL